MYKYIVHIQIHVFCVHFITYICMYTSIHLCTYVVYINIYAHVYVK